MKYDVVTYIQKKKVRSKGFGCEMKAIDYLAGLCYDSAKVNKERTDTSTSCWNDKFVVYHNQMSRYIVWDFSDYNDVTFLFRVFDRNDLTIYKDFYIYYVKGKYYLDEADGDKLVCVADSLEEAFERGGRKI